MRPLISLPSGMVSGEAEFWNSSRLENLAQADDFAPGVRDFDADGRLAGNALDQDRFRLQARGTGLRSAFVIRLYLMPASGLNSNVVTTGPGLICTTEPETLNSSNFALDSRRDVLQFLAVVGGCGAAAHSAVWSTGCGRSTAVFFTGLRSGSRRRVRRGIGSGSASTGSPVGEPSLRVCGWESRLPMGAVSSSAAAAAIGGAGQCRAPRSSPRGVARVARASGTYSASGADMLLLGGHARRRSASSRFVADAASASALAAAFSQAALRRIACQSWNLIQRRLIKPMGPANQSCSLLIGERGDQVERQRQAGGVQQHRACRI